MMTVNQYQEDIFSEWKSQRFIVVDAVIARDNMTSHMVVLTDIYFWAEHQDDLDKWCDEHPGVYQMGMTVSFETQEMLTLFTLRWS